jgi:hypothetical protein
MSMHPSYPSSIAYTTTRRAVVYTRWKNLHKTASMDVGAIGFHDRSKVRKVRVTKDNAIVNRITKTKEVG